jgi:hypothetical protein
LATQPKDWSQGGWKKLMSSGTRGPYRMVERRWVLEYIMTKCANAIYIVAHKRLGALPPDIVSRAAGLPATTWKVYLPYVDGVCVWPDRIELIEFKVHDPLKAVAQLLYYKVLAMQDEELRKFMPRPIVLKLVYWRYDPNLDAVCRANGIVFEVDKPAWLDPILRDYGYKV